MFGSLKLYAAVAVVFVILALVAVIGFARAKSANALSDLRTADTTIAVQKDTVAQKEQNAKAQKKASAGKQQDAEQIAPINQAIDQLEGPRYLNEKESEVARNLARHFNCSGVYPIGPDCNPKPGVLQPPGKAGLVSIESVLRAWEVTIEYSHDYERTGQCYEESMKVTK